MNNYQLYVEYFKNLCVQHKELLHEDNSGKIVFMVQNWEEALGKFRTGIQEKKYAFQLINYTSKGIRVGDDRRMNLQCAFIVSHYHSNRNAGELSYISAMIKSGKVAQQFMDRMVHDARLDHPLMGDFAYDMESFGGRPIDNVGDGTYSGWLVSFELNPKVECPFPKASEEVWLDL